VRPDDFNKAFDEAIAKIEPRDEAHRAKLEKMKERIHKVNAEMAVEISKVEEMVSGLDKDRSERKSSYDGMFEMVRDMNVQATEMFNEQAARIDKIAAKLGQ